jgi:GR25 family glycosyltransferase involved in LPS biosynthesis
MPKQAINDVFEQVIVVNLDRRPDRLASVAAQLQHLGVSFQRFPAIDGQDPGVAAEWVTYAQGEPTRLPNGMRPVASWREFYLDYDSELARVAFFEAQRGRAIATPGAWGLLRSMSAIVERAVAERWQSVLVLEDDVLFHKDAVELFDRFMAQLPADWKVLQLGAMQLHWQNDWISWHSDNLYLCQGSSLGAHAFALCADVLPEVLESSRTHDLPFDIGALHTIKRRHASHSFTMFPNLAIQDAADSDIGSSTMFFREARQIDNIYRWYLPDYGLAAIETRGAAAAARAPTGSAGAAAAPLAPGRPTSGTWRGMLSRLRDHAVMRSGRGRANAAGDGAASASTGASKVVAPARPLGGQPPLKVRSLKQPKAHAIMALVVGLAGDELIGVLDLLRAQRARSDLEPIPVTDCDAFELFRARQLAFEFLPAPGLRARLAPELDWDLYLLRRLALLRRKWQPVRIVAFGPTATQLLLQWKDSPLEDDSIHQVAAAAAKSTEMT